MSKALGLRADFDAPALRRLACASRDVGQSRRPLALAARIGAVGLQTVCDCVLAFNAAGPDGLIECKKPGPRFKLDAVQRQALTAAIKAGLALDRRQPGREQRRARGEAPGLFQALGAPARP